MPTTKRAVENGIRRVLHDYHYGMDAAGVFYHRPGQAWVSLNLNSGLTADDYHRALAALPWSVQITQDSNKLVVTEATA